MKKWAEENKTRWIDYDIYKDGLKYILQLIPGCSCMLKKPFQHTWQTLEEFFQSIKDNKTPFVNISSETKDSKSSMKS
jgi:hypothetical protein